MSTSALSKFGHLGLIATMLAMLAAPASAAEPAASDVSHFMVCLHDMFFDHAAYERDCAATVVSAAPVPGTAGTAGPTGKGAISVRVLAPPKAYIVDTVEENDG